MNQATLLLIIGLSLGVLTTSTDKESTNKEAGASSYASYDFNDWTMPYALFSDHHDESDEIEMQVKVGEVPSFLRGSLYRVGPGMFSLGKRRVSNLIDGLGKINRWSFNNRTVKFSAKFLKSEIYNRTLAAGEILPMRYMGKFHPPLSTFEEMKVLLFDAASDNNNIAMWDLGDAGVTATTESPIYIDVQYDTLDFIRKYTPKSSDASAFHPEILSATHFNKVATTGNSINYKLVLKTTPAYQFYEYKTSADGQVFADLIGSIPVAFNDFRLVHSIGVTEHFAILPRFSLCFVMRDPVHIGADIRWDATKPTVFDILSIKDKHHYSFKFSAHEAQHVINSFERTNSENELEIVIDYPTRVYPDDFTSVYDMLDIDCLKDPNCNTSTFIKGTNHERITRFILNIDTGVGTQYDYPVMWSPSPSEGTTIEFPIINPAYRGRPYCYAYFHVWSYDQNNGMGLMKADMCQETSIGWYEKNKFPVEPIFVERPDATEEDDGVIVGPVFDAVLNSTSLYVWNAQNLEVLAVLDSPVIVPFTLHGVWIDNVGL